MENLCKGVSIIIFPTLHDDVRGGSLTYGQCVDQLPFIPKRFFYVYNVPVNSERGAHAHKSLMQCIICLKGSVSLVLDNGTSSCTYTLCEPSIGLVLDKLIWSTQQYIEDGSVLLVLASEEFSEEEYIRNYDEFQGIVKKQIIQPVKFLDLKPGPEASLALANAFLRVLNSGQYVLGPDVLAFEKEWASYCNARYCIGLGSGLDALILMLRASDFEIGSEIIVPANTYIATILGVTMADLVPILVEPHPRTHNIDVQKIEACVTSRTKAILAVDLYGQPADRDAIAAIAKKYNLRIFSDAAQSHGARYKGEVVGSMYDATAFSFYPSKNLGAFGEAGAVCTNDGNIADRIRMLRNYGSRIRYENELKGVNSRLDTIQAALLRVNIKSLDVCNAHRLSIASYYLRNLHDLPWLTLPIVPEFALPSWHLFVIQCKDRNALRDHLEEHGIPTLIHYPIPPHLSKAYADLGYKEGSFPITERLSDTILSLPCGPHMSKENIFDVVSAMRSFSPKHETASRDDIKVFG